MKKGLLFLAMAFSFLFSACTKEKSIEKALEENQENFWRFTQGTKEYSGTVDTAFVEVFSNIQFMVIEGYSSNGNGQILLGFGGTTLQVGEYLSPFANLFYAEDNAALFESSAIDPNFKIVITELTDTKVSGTFSGTVQISSSGDPVTISNGRFSANR